MNNIRRWWNRVQSYNPKRKLLAKPMNPPKSSRKAVYFSPPWLVLLPHLSKHVVHLFVAPQTKFKIIALGILISLGNWNCCHAFVENCIENTPSTTAACKTWMLRTLVVDQSALIFSSSTFNQLLHHLVFWKPHWERNSVECIRLVAVKNRSMCLQKYSRIHFLQKHTT